MAVQRLTEDYRTPWLQGDQGPTDPMGQQEAPAAAGPPDPWSAAASPTAHAPAPSAAPAGGGWDYTHDLGLTAQTPAATPAGPSRAPQPASTNYQPLLSAVQTATDPAAQSVARDTLARSVQQDLEGDGHTVTWKGDQLIVDGRPYELGGAAPLGTAALGSAPTRANNPSPQPAGTAPGPDTPTTPGALGPSSFRVTDEPHQPYQGSPGTPGYDYVAFRNAWFSAPPGTDAQTFINQHPEFTQGATLSHDGEYINLPGGESMDAQRNFGVGQSPQWGNPDYDYETGRRYTPQEAAAAEAAWAGQHPGGGGGASRVGGGGGFGGGNPMDIPDWLRNPEADPNLMATAGSIPGFEDVYNRIASTSPEEQATSDLVKQILAHPESLSERDVETLKAKNAEELAAAGQAQDEELQHFGGQSGLMDSPWLAAQRADTSWNRRSATVASNRNVDISAAEKRQADRLSSASLGKEWATYQKGKSVQAISSAVEAGMAKGNLEQAAKTLGLTKNQLMVSYIGINMNYDVNLKTLQQKGEQFAQDLAQRIAEMKLRDQEFLDSLQLDKDKFAWDKAQSTFDQRPN